MKRVLTCEIPNLPPSQNPCQMSVHPIFSQQFQFSPHKSSVQVMKTTGVSPHLSINFSHFLPPSLWLINIQIDYLPSQKLPDFNIFIPIMTLVNQVVFFSLEPALWDTGGAICVPASGLSLDSSCSLLKGHLPKSLLEITQRFPPAHLLRSRLVSLNFHNPPPVIFLPPYSLSAFVDFSPKHHILTP